MKYRSCTLVHLIKFVNATHTIIGQHQGTSIRHINIKLILSIDKATYIICISKYKIKHVLLYSKEKSNKTSKALEAFWLIIEQVLNGMTYNSKDNLHFPSMLFLSLNTKNIKSDIF